MKQTAEKVVKELDKMMDDVRNRIFQDDILDDIEPEDFKLLIHVLKISELSKQLLIEEAEALDNINEKLDKLLSKGE